jgi:hypothetical protein
VGSEVPRYDQQADGLSGELPAGDWQVMPIRILRPLVFILLIFGTRSRFERIIK